jgi:hypothetical protein
MLRDTSRNKWRRFGPVLISAFAVVALIGMPVGRNLLARAFRSLRMQKVQAVNVNLSAFTDPNANPALHQLIAQMISDDVVVAANEPDQPATDAAAAAQLGGFDVSVVGDRKDPPKFVVTSRHAFNMRLARANERIHARFGVGDARRSLKLNNAHRSYLAPRGVSYAASAGRRIAVFAVCQCFRAQRGDGGICRLLSRHNFGLSRLPFSTA